MTEVEKILAELKSINDYDIDYDFDDSEIETLLSNMIISPRDLGMSRASDLIIAGILDYEQYPFEFFSDFEQLRQLDNGIITPDDFLAKADIDIFNAGSWLYLLSILPQLAEKAPWDMIRKDGSLQDWLFLLKSCPEFMGYADWNALLANSTLRSLFKLLDYLPGIYKYLPDKDKVLAADSSCWVKLLANTPELAEYYPLENLNKMDEIEFLLLQQPELANRISWDEKNPPVKLFVSNPTAKPATAISRLILPSETCEALAPILKKFLPVNSDEDIEDRAKIIENIKETFVGIYNSQKAETIMREFQSAVAAKQLDLQIRKEDV